MTYKLTQEGNILLIFFGSGPGVKKLAYLAADSGKNEFTNRLGCVYCLYACCSVPCASYRELELPLHAQLW